MMKFSSYIAGLPVRMRSDRWTCQLMVGFCLVWLGCSQPLSADDALRRDATVRAVERTMPSVVNIRTEILVERRDFYYDLLLDYFGPYYRRRPAESTYSLGSGVIIHASGYVLTNAHVVSRASRIEVILQDGTRLEAEPVAGMKSKDVALLRIVDSKGLPAYPAVQFAREDDLMLGETVLALGNPFGLGSSVSRGILSSKNRRPPMENEPLEIEDWLQTDAAINPGNSGGPLINLNGEMIGLNVAVFKEGQGIGFAIPIKLVNEALAEIMTPEFLNGLWFGAKIDPGERPLRVRQVIPASPAAQAGLQIGDAILKVNGQGVDHMIDLHRMLTATQGKSAIRVKVEREGELKDLTLTLRPEKEFFNAAMIRRRTGMTLQEITPAMARHLGLDAVQGAIVAEVEKESPAAHAGIKTGFIVHRWNQFPVSDLVGLAKQVHASEPGDRVQLEVLIQRKVGRFLTLNRASAVFPLR